MPACGGSLARRRLCTAARSQSSKGGSSRIIQTSCSRGGITPSSFAKRKGRNRHCHPSRRSIPMRGDNMHVGENTNETSVDDEVEAHGLPDNTNETAVDDEVEAHGS